jgi:hypothetical protein
VEGVKVGIALFDGEGTEGKTETGKWVVRWRWEMGWRRFRWRRWGKGKGTYRIS